MQLTHAFRHPIYNNKSDVWYVHPLHGYTCTVITKATCTYHPESNCCHNTSDSILCLKSSSNVMLGGRCEGSMVHTHIAFTVCSLAQKRVHTTGSIFCLCKNKCFRYGPHIDIAKLFSNST